MRFTLLDRIVDLEVGKRIVAIKSLSLAEEYLADHFPSAPVMPGVMMLEALVQASAWLVRVSEDFAHSIVVLKQARGVKYANFVDPGQTLTVTAELTGQDERETKLKAQGTVNGAAAVSAKLVLERYNIAGRDVADGDPTQAATDQYTIERLRHLLSLLWRREPAAT
jgi:3-hydroxyacyl-[acyl-carrier-protein] dehydratase